MLIFFRMLASANRYESNATTVAGLGVLIIAIYVGYAIPRPSMRVYFRWLSYAQPVSFGFEALLANEFRKLNVPCAQLAPSGPGYEGVAAANQVCTTTGSAPGQTVVRGLDYLEANFGYKWSHTWRNFGFVRLLVLDLIWKTAFSRTAASRTTLTLVLLVLPLVLPRADLRLPLLLLGDQPHHVRDPARRDGRRRRHALPPWPRAEGARRRHRGRRLVRRRREGRRQRPPRARHGRRREGEERRRRHAQVGVRRLHVAQRQLHGPGQGRRAQAPQQRLGLRRTWQDDGPHGRVRRRQDDPPQCVLLSPSFLSLLAPAPLTLSPRLADVLAQRVSVGVVTGDMLVNGKPLPQSFQRQTGYCQQQDTHMATTTVREALVFSALLRQPRTTPKAEKLAYVEEIIKLLEMEAYAEALVGEVGMGLNVEQRKRLTIGVELAAKPALLIFLDEPTSGLDSQSSWSIMLLLRKLADHGQAILATIHQPSSELFQQFDRLLLLKKGGATVFFGDLGKNSQTMLCVLISAFALVPVFLLSLR